MIDALLCEYYALARLTDAAGTCMSVIGLEVLSARWKNLSLLVFLLKNATLNDSCMNSCFDSDKRR